MVLFLVALLSSNIFAEVVLVQTDYGNEAITTEINSEHACYQACKPKEIKYGPKKARRSRMISGLQRSGCGSCLNNLVAQEEFSKRENTPQTLDDITLYEGSKCSNYCSTAQDVPLRLLSYACKRCVGVDGHPGESFIYIKSKSENCYEVDNNKIVRSVAVQACVDHEAITTVYRIDNTTVDG